MLTTPITNDHFHSRVLSVLRSYTQAAADGHVQALPLISSLEDADTPLAPSEIISQLLIYTSSWIDLASPDPVIAHVSRQVFSLEVKYAAFCGATTAVIPGPRLSHGTDGLAQYARAIKEALPIAGYVQLHILMPMDSTKTPDSQDHASDLAHFARAEYAQKAKSQTKSVGAFAAWDAWNTVRSICRYHNRLSVGKNGNRVFLEFQLVLHTWHQHRRLLSDYSSSRAPA